MSDFMREAIRLSLDHMRDDHGGPFGAVIVRGDDIIARGWNQVPSTNDPTAHAEIVAIRAACNALGTFDLKGCDLYASCEPCPMCLAACYWARLDRIYYAATRSDAAAAGFDDAAIYDEVQTPQEQRAVAMVPLLRDEALVVLEEWKAKENRVRY